MKIIIFGGTFDPWTSAHQEIAERLSKNYDSVLIVPTTVRYYKVNKQMFSFNERFEQAEKKVAGLKNVEVCDIERSVDDDWRFVDTLKKIIELNGTKHEYYVAIGSDSLQKFKTWYEWERILQLAKLVVFNRPGYESDFPDIPFEYLEMNNSISSTALRQKLMQIMSDEEFEDLLDEDWLIKGQKNLMED
nr:nicotinate-nicotinamide nucleotide adenylyltransferase [uncultured Treponema sp.]